MQAFGNVWELVEHRRELRGASIPESAIISETLKYNGITGVYMFSKSIRCAHH